MKPTLPLLGTLLLSAMATGAAADSYVFVTNSTPETVTLDINHFGDRTLSEGSQWAREATEIGPWETRRVLRFNRNSGVKSGKTYQFETRVSAGQDAVVLTQKMRGTWYGSTIQHSARADDFQAPWYSDRNIHTFATHYDARPSANSFRAEFTGGYDDFHYTIHNQPVTEAASGSNGFKVLTYNVWALPFVASDIDARLGELPKHLKGYDAILLQEVFAGSRDGFLDALAVEYPYQTAILNAPGINLFDGGVLIVSRWPIVRSAEYAYPDCTGTDCFAEKGVVYAEIIKQGKAYHLTSTHTASFDSDEARALRQQQFQQIRALADAQAIGPQDALLMGGDFNVNKLKFPGDYADMLYHLAATDPVSTGYTAATFDPRVNQNAGAAFSGGDAVEYLDYVVFSNDHRLPVESRNDVRVPRSLAAPLWGTWDLSDHFPVLGDFAY